jgi:hypothetical protein
MEPCKLEPLIEAGRWLEWMEVLFIVQSGLLEREWLRV